MNYVIILFGLLIVVLSLFILLRPQAALEYAAAKAGSIGMYISAVTARVGIGLVVLIYADQSRFPHTMEILAYLFIAAGLGLALAGPGRFERMVHWFIDRFAGMRRVSGSLGVILGLFLVYAVI